MTGLFGAGSPVHVVVPTDGADATDLARLAHLLDQESAELAIEFGAPAQVVRGGAPASRRLELRVEPHLVRPRLGWASDGDEVLVASGPDLDGAVEALSLLRSLRWAEGKVLEAAPAPSLGDAMTRLEDEVRRTHPSVATGEVDWADISRRCREDVDPSSPLSGLQRWVAALGDAHTSVREAARPGHLACTARVEAGRVVLAEVPEGTPAADAGVRAGDELLDVDVADLWARTGAPAHLKPWLVGRLALAGPVDEPRSHRVRCADGTVATFVDTPRPAFARPPVERRLLSSGTAYLRVLTWPPGVNDLVDDALAELGGADRLLVDLRGNVGGNLVEAVRFRERFLDRQLILGSIQFSVGDGTMSRPFPVTGQPGDARPWRRRVRFLVDALTYSASEDALLGLRQLPQVDVVGHPSGGGSGRARTIRLLDDLVLHVSTARTFDHDGRIVEGAGIAVDRHLDSAASVWQADRDW